MNTKMRVGVIIEARYYSSRLYGKTMMEVKGKPLLDLLIQRVKPSKLADDIIVATTVKKDCDIIEDYCKKNNITCFRGSEDDVLERVLLAAKKNNIDIIVELTADCPLVNADLIDKMIKFYLENDYDYVSTFMNKRTFPVGYDVRIFPTKILEEVEKITRDPNDRENVSIFISNHPEKYKTGVFSARGELNHSEYRLLVDKKEDFELMKKIFENFDTFNFSIKEVIDFLKKNPQLYSINENVTHKWYKMYRAAIVGLGRMGQLFENDTIVKKPCTHASAYSYLKDKIRLVAGCDIREDRLKLFGEKWNLNRLYKNYKEMLKKEEIDVLSVCTHATEHKEIVIEAARSGVKAIFCEKPISTNLKDAEEMIRICKENNVILCIDHTRRFDNLWRKAKEIIDSGSIGEIKSMHTFSTAGLLNGGTHLFDLLRFYNGEINSVYGKLKRDETSDASGIGLLKFENGTYGYVDIDVRDYSKFQINIVGSEGIMRLGGMIRGGKNFELWVPKPSQTQTGIKELELQDFPETKGEMALVNAVNEIIEAIETGKDTISTGEDGLKALEIGLAFYDSDELDKEIKLPLRNRDRNVIPRKTSFTKDGNFPECYEKDNILPGF